MQANIVKYYSKKGDFMKDSLWLYRIFDVAEEFDLESVEKSLSVEKTISRMRLSRVKSKSIQIDDPPVYVEMGSIETSICDFHLYGSISAKVYNFGIVSILLRLTLPENISYDELKKLSLYISGTPELENIFCEHLDGIKKSLDGTYAPTSQKGFMEDFTIYYFRKWDKTLDPAQLLLSESEPLSAQTIEDTVKNSFSYGLRDLAVITWDSALVYDEDGSTDIPDLLEFALTQLLVLRYYDDLLSEELNTMHEYIGKAQTFRFYSRLTRYRKITRDLLKVVLDMTEITEKVQNSIKVTEDVFYARVYGAAQVIFNTENWNKNIERKISVIVETYNMLKAEIENTRSFMLEAAIVLLILIEIIMGFIKLM